TVNPNLSAIPAQRNGLAQIVGHMLWLEQLKAIGITIALALVGTSLIGLIVRATIGLRITPEIERQGLDINLHGEEGYIVSGWTRAAARLRVIWSMNRFMELRNYDVNSIRRERVIITNVWLDFPFTGAPSSCVDHLEG